MSAMPLRTAEMAVIDDPTAKFPSTARPPKDGPRLPTLDEMGPGVESKPARGRGLPDEARSTEAGPRSTMGRPGQHGGFKSNRKR